MHSSVKLELQADCLSGVWAHDADRTRQLLESGDAGGAECGKRQQAMTACRNRLVDTSPRILHSWYVRSASSGLRKIERGNINVCNTFESRQL